MPGGTRNLLVDRVQVTLYAAAKTADVRQEANEDILEAKLKVAIEKCDSLAGSAKDGCVTSAKAQYEMI